MLVRLEDVLGGKLVLARKVDKVFKRTLCGFRLLRGFDGGAACRDVGEQGGILTSSRSGTISVSNTSDVVVGAKRKTQ